MGLVTALAIGGALAGGMLLGKLGKKGDQQQAAPGIDPAAVDLTADQKVAATNPVSAPAAESAAVSAAGTVAARTRRRAKAGNAGPVSTGAGGTPGVTAGGSARSLVGY